MKTKKGMGPLCPLSVSLLRRSFEYSSEYMTDGGVMSGISGVKLDERRSNLVAGEGLSLLILGSSIPILLMVMLLIEYDLAM